MITDGTTSQILNDLLDPVSGAGISLISAFDINNEGQIVGNATTDAGDVVGYLLNPMRAPETAELARGRRPGPQVPVRELGAWSDFLSKDEFVQKHLRQAGGRF
jgi:hypothetical protein